MAQFVSPSLIQSYEVFSEKAAVPDMKMLFTENRYRDYNRRKLKNVKEGQMGFAAVDNLIKVVRSGFEKIKDHRAANVSISLTDALMSGFALFALKDSSLLEFDERRAKDENLKQIYKLEQVPSDSQMRTIVDEVDPLEIRPVYQTILNGMEERSILDQMKYMGKYDLLSVDGTEHYNSEKVHCPSCLIRNKRNGVVSYRHQLLGATIVHPDCKAVIPLAPEPIIKQDGQTKNDCEQNAAKRLFAQIRADHPKLPLIVVEDALSPNAPHLRMLKGHNLRFIIGVKEGDHAFLFEQVRAKHKAGESGQWEERAKGITHRFRFINQVPLNESNPDVLVNFLEYWEIKGDEVQHFCWVTDFIRYDWNVLAIMRGGRARWKIENETFNTLKNQGYHFEHNFGHGKLNLAVNFVHLMMLAFLVDQVQQLADALFQAVLKKEGSRKRLWAHMRALFYTLNFSSMADIFKALLYGYTVDQVTILGPA